MLEAGFEPAKALSHWILSPAHLTALELQHKIPFPTSLLKLIALNPS